MKLRSFKQTVFYKQVPYILCNRFSNIVLYNILHISHHNEEDPCRAILLYRDKSDIEPLIKILEKFVTNKKLKEIGLIVKDEFGLEYGKIDDIINLPTNDSLIFIYKDKEILIPISDDFIELFDFKHKMVIVKNSDIFINKC